MTIGLLIALHFHVSTKSAFTELPKRGANKKIRWTLTVERAWHLISRLIWWPDEVAFEFCPTALLIVGTLPCSHDSTTADWFRIQRKYYHCWRL